MDNEKVAEKLTDRFAKVLVSGEDDYVSVGFIVSMSEDSIIEEHIADFMDNKGVGLDFVDDGLITLDGEITGEGAQQTDDDMEIIEKNAVDWLSKNFISARDEGHVGDNSLGGTVIIDPTDKDQISILNDCEPAGGDALTFRDEYVRDVGIYNGVSEFTEVMVDTDIIFIDLPDKIQELI